VHPRKDWKLCVSKVPQLIIKEAYYKPGFLFDTSDGLKLQTRKIWDGKGIRLRTASGNPSWLALFYQIDFGKEQKSKLSSWKLIPFKLVMH
jgi:hypothetical protein